MQPLEDIRVVSLEQYGAGPFGSLHLAELGAEVIKVENPSDGGDVGRWVPPYADDGESLFFESFNRNKLSISVELSTPAGRSVFEDLVGRADAVYSNLRGDVPAKLGIRYDDLKAINPRIVCCSLTGFGMTGPRAAEPGYDYILQALAGWMSVTGEPGGPPEKAGLSVVDYSGGLVAALSLLAGVHAARRDGVGGDCDVSLYDTAIGMLTYPATWHLTRGWEPGRTRHSAHPSLVPFQAFEAADGWLVIACPKEKFWQRLTVVLDRPALAADPRFATFSDRAEHREELLAILEPALRRRSVAEWLPLLYTAGVPCGPVNTVAEALADPHTEARGMVVRTDHPRFGVVSTVASPARFGPRPAAQRRGPRQGEHTREVLRRVLGYDDAAIDRALRSGALGSTQAPERGSPPQG